MSTRGGLKDLLTTAPWVRAVLALFALVVLGVCLRYVVRAPPKRIVIAADGADGAFSRFAHGYVDKLAAQGVTLEIVTTNGGVDNLSRLDSGTSHIDIAFVNGGLTNAAKSPGLESLGTVAYAPIWIVYRSALGELDGIPKLKGLRIGIGRAGSGTQVLARRMLDASGVTSANASILDDGGTDTATQALLAKSLDVAFILGAPEEPKIKALFADDRLRVMNMADAEGLSRNLSFLHALRVPRSTIDLARQQPDRDLSIVSSTVTLVARKDVHPALVYLLMSVVDEVHEPPSLLHKENEFPSDKDTDLPLSPQAESYYRSGKPFLQRYLPFGLASLVERLLKVAVPILIVVVPFLRVVPQFYQWRVKRKLARIYSQLLDVERAAKVASDQSSFSEHEARLRALEQALHAENIPLMYSNEVYVLREHIELARRQIAMSLAARSA